jgi:hypothetical protein
MTVVLGGAATALTWGLAWSADDMRSALLMSLVAGLGFGVLLGGAVVATMQARERRASSTLVFGVSLVVGIVLCGSTAYLGQRSAGQESIDACSAEALDAFTAMSFYADVDQRPTGTQFGSCYVVYTLDETGQQASDTLQQLLADNGWPVTCDPVFRDDGGYRCRSGEQDGLVLEVFWEGSHDLPGDDLAYTDDGATTVAIDITAWDPRMGP